MEHRAGFVNILGKPNAGKSTLLNAILGEKLSIITHKAQTTRHRIMGMVNEDDLQIVFSDTPGIIQPSYKLQEKMMDFVEESLKDADVFLLVVDGADPDSLQADSDLYRKVEERLQKSEAPVVVALNKLDLIQEETLGKLGELLRAKFPTADLVPISAQTGFNVDTLMRIIKEKIPVHPPYYDKEDISDKPMRFFASEMIREHILELYQQEIPYSVEVRIQDYKESPEIVRITAEILVSRDSQKSILIGKNGEAIKKLGVNSRQSLEKFLGNKVYLGLFVKVKKDWRNDERTLNFFGY